MKNLFIFFIFCSHALFSQESVQGTVRVENPQVASVYLKAITPVTAPNAGNIVTFNISLTFDTKGLLIAPVAIPTLQGSFSTIGIAPLPPYIEQGRFVYTYVLNGSIPTFTWNSEIPLINLSFSNLDFSQGNFPRLQNDESGGIGGQSYFYIEVNGTDVTNYSDVFYGGNEGANPIQYVEALSPLPIILMTFNAKKHSASSAKLDWTTSKEVNSDYFGIERSKDGSTWEEIGRVKAAGDSNIDLAYAYIDDQLPLSRTNGQVFYYRLRMTDLDGAYKYSDVRGVNFDRQALGPITIYPNPTTEIVNIDLSEVDMQNGDVSVSVYDMSGRQVITKKIIGSGIELIKVDQLPADAYNFIVRQGGQIYQQRVIKID